MRTPHTPFSPTPPQVYGRFPRFFFFLLNFRSPYFCQSSFCLEFGFSVWFFLLAKLFVYFFFASCLVFVRFLFWPHFSVFLKFLRPSFARRLLSLVVCHSILNYLSLGRLSLRCPLFLCRFSHYVVRPVFALLLLGVRHAVTLSFQFLLVTR